MKNSVALRVKYRPQEFSQMVGIQHLLPQITNIIRYRKIMPYLITGPYGSGKSTFAELLLRSLKCNCPEGVESCGKCKSCKRLQLFQGGFDVCMLSGDMVSPLNIQKLKDDLRFCPMDSGFHTVFIDDLDHAKPDSINRIISLININDSTLMVFTATDVKALPIPLVHRCFQFKLGNYSTVDLQLLLNRIIKSEKFNYDVPNISELLEDVDYNPRLLLNHIEVLNGT